MTSAFCYFLLLFPHIFILIINIKIKNKYYIKLKLQLQFKKNYNDVLLYTRHKHTIHKHYYIHGLLCIKTYCFKSFKHEIL
jgi:hypothetical protein